MSIDTNKAYLLGLLVGGGVISDKSFQIILPYKKWGDLKGNPSRAGDISSDILQSLSPLWKTAYNIDVSYKVGSDWKILSNALSPDLLNDLSKAGLPIAGELREHATLKNLLPLLTSFEHKKSFITGLVDTIGSLAPSHRRFVNEFQIISFEFKGRNFELVKDVAMLLDACGFPPDQILWNHPNQHSGSCRYYKSWKKGFKVRISLDDYMLKGGFVFKSKKLSASDNSKKSSIVATAKGKDIKIQGRVTIHKDENSEWLPSDVRGKHFVHYLQFCEFYGVPTPSAYNGKKIIDNFERYFCPFTCLTKGDLRYIEGIIAGEDYLHRSVYKPLSLKCSSLKEMFIENPASLVAGTNVNNGFPVNMILHGMAYVAAATAGDTKGNSKRVPGKYIDYLNATNDERIHNQLGINIYIPDRATCLLIKNEEFGALVGYVDDKFNKTLIVSKAGCKVVLREPTFEECILL